MEAAFDLMLRCTAAPLLQTAKRRVFTPRLLKAMQ